MWRLDLHPVLFEEKIMVVDNDLIILHPIKSIVCSQHKDFVCHDFKSMHDHICSENHLRYVRWFADSRESLFPLDIIHICSHCRVICKDIQDHYKTRHDCTYPSDELMSGSSEDQTDLLAVERAYRRQLSVSRPHSLETLIKICSPIEELPDHHLTDSEYCHQLELNREWPSSGSVSETESDGEKNDKEARENDEEEVFTQS